jgi:hypothetical protein
MGFVAYGVELRALRYAGRDYDELLVFMMDNRRALAPRSAQANDCMMSPGRVPDTEIDSVPNGQLAGERCRNRACDRAGAASELSNAGPPLQGRDGSLARADPAGRGSSAGFP